jgi:anaerobic ribonucleoside-triphosphate reductase activating protein
VIVFSGYTLEERKLRADRDPGVGRLLAATDVLVDGPYDAARPETGRRWAGSTNQRFHYLSGRYSSAIERPGPGEPLRTVEVRLTLDGRVSVNGWPAVTASGWSRPRDGELRLVKYGNVEP